METLLIILTCKRPGPSYLAGTVERFQDEGADAFVERIVLSDGNPEWPPPPGWRNVINFRGPSGGRRAMWNAFELAISRKNWEQVLICEDDLIPAPYALAYADALTVPRDVGFINLMEMKEKPRWEPGQNGPLYRCDFNNRPSTVYFCGTQALLYRRETVHWLATRDPWHPTMPDDLKIHQHMQDCAIGWWLGHGSSPWRYYLAHSPAMFEHVGVVSTWTDEGLKGRTAIEANPLIPTLDEVTPTRGSPP